MDIEKNMQKMQFGRAFEEIRNQRKLSFEEFLDKYDIRSSVYSELIFNIDMPNIELVKELCKKIGYPFEALAIRAIDIDKLSEESHQKLVTEIRPILNEISYILYPN